CLREIERHQAADQSYLEEGVRLLELARNAQRLFEKQEPREKRRLLNFVVSNCTWKGGEVVADLRQPFDLLAETTAITAQAAAGKRANLTKSEIWLAVCQRPHPTLAQVQEPGGPGGEARGGRGMGMSYLSTTKTVTLTSDTPAILTTVPET